MRYLTRYPFPSLVGENSLHCRLAYVEEFSDFVLRHFSPKSNYFFHLFVAKLVVWAWTPATFCYHISRVVCVCSKKQMIRVNAWRIIALVKHAKTIWNSSPMDHPRNSVRGCGNVAVFSNDSVFGFASRWNPKPAFSKFRSMCWNWSELLNLFPKSRKYGFGKTLRYEKSKYSVVLHFKSVLICHAFGCANSARAFPFLSPTMEESK